MKSEITYEYCFYLNFLIAWTFISIQQVEQAIYHRRIFLYTYLKEDSKILQFFKGGFILSTFQIIKSMIMSLMLAFVFIEFEPLMWLVVLIFGLIFYFLKNMFKNALKVSVHEELSDQFAQSLTKWTIVLFHMAALIAIQLYQPVNDLSGISFKSAYEQLHHQNQLILLPSIGILLEYLSLGHHLSFWAIQNINHSHLLISEKILQYVILAWFCISSVFYTWFLLYFYAGLCVASNGQDTFSRLKKLDRRYFGENQR
jgi:hypothetical protein